VCEAIEPSLKDCTVSYLKTVFHALYKSTGSLTVPKT